MSCLQQGSGLSPAAARLSCVAANLWPLRLNCYLLKSCQCLPSSHASRCAALSRQQACLPAEVEAGTSAALESVLMCGVKQ
jgi:hypothetical protein